MGPAQSLQLAGGSPPPHRHVPRLCSVDRPLLPGHQSSRWAEKQGPRRVLDGGHFLGPCLWATCTFKTTSMSYVWDLLWLPWAATLPLPPGTPVEGWHPLAHAEPYEAGLPLIPRGDDITAFEALAGAGQVPQRTQVCPGTRNTREPVPYTPAPAAPAVRPPLAGLHLHLRSPHHPPRLDLEGHPQVRGKEQSP